MRTPVLLLTALIAITPAAAAQDTDSLPPPNGTALMSGRVIDATTGQPIPGVTIHIRELRRLTMTNDFGGFVLENLPEGTYTWSFRRLGYATWESESPVRDRDWFTVRLLPQPEVIAGLTVVADGFERRRRAVSAAVHTIDETDMVGSGHANAFNLIRGRGNLSLASCGGAQAFACVYYRGGYTRPAIYVDDQRFPGGLPDLAIYSTAELHAIDVLRGNTGVRIFVTTRQYAERLARLGRSPDPFSAVEGFMGNSLRP
jgi:hypothetical protein